MTQQNGFQPSDLSTSDTGHAWETWEEKEMASPLSAAPPPHLLLVETDPGLQTFLELALREEGYTLQVASSLQQALAFISVQRFDFVLAHLPADRPRKLFRVLKPLKERIPATKLGVITDWNSSAEEAENQGWAFILPRPLAVEQLLAEIAICLDTALTPEQERQVQVVERFLEVLMLQDRSKALSLCAEDIVCYPPAPPLLPLAHPLRGKAALEQYLEVLHRRFQAFRLEVQDVYSRPRGLAVRYHMWWSASRRGWEMMGGTLLLQFKTDRIRQIGWQADMH
jgi:ActR/RegA family two-component response regulator